MSALFGACFEMVFSGQRPPVPGPKGNSLYNTKERRNKGNEMFKKLTLLITFGFIAITAAVEAKDIIVHIESTSHKGQQAEEIVTKIYISGEDVKVVTDKNLGHFLFKGGEDLLWFVDEAKETYTEVDEELIADLNEYIGKMRNRLQQMPTPQREMAKRMMQQQMDQLKVSLEEEDMELDYNQTGQTKDINSYPSRKLEVLKDSVKIEDIWFTEWDNIEYKKEIESAYTAMWDFLSSLRNILDESVLNNYGEMPFIRFDQNEKLKGMPVSSVHYDENNNVINETTLQKIEAVELSDDAFLPPEGYQLVKPEFPE